jgi:hypothetical protein
MIRDIREMSNHLGEINSQKNKKINKIIRNNGKKKARSEINHHLSG